MKPDKSALLVIDMQNDFIPGGSLAVAGGDELIGLINDLMKMEWKLVVASQDWHPSNHISFDVNHKGAETFDLKVLPDGSKQVMWPVHCVQGTKGAEIHDDIDAESIDKIVFKGENPDVDSYSAFFDNNHAEKTDMDNLLRSEGIEDIYVVGLAGDFCVKFTAIDGQGLGYNSHFILDATKLVNPDNEPATITELKASGVTVLNIADLLS